MGFLPSGGGHPTVRPPELIDDVEDGPFGGVDLSGDVWREFLAHRLHVLDDLVEATGCKSLPRKQKTLCCGSGGGLKAAFGDVAKEFTKTNLENMQASGAQFIVDVCPFCHLQFDTSEKDLGFNIPVLHLSQLYGIAMKLECWQESATYKTFRRPTAF